MSLVRFHLWSCDFCSAEIPLLSHYSHPQRGESRVPEIPINLRVLAESLLQEGKDRSAKLAAGKKMQPLVKYEPRVEAENGNPKRLSSRKFGKSPKR